MKRIDFVVMVAAVLVVLLIAGCVSAPQKETSTSAETTSTPTQQPQTTTSTQTTYTSPQPQHNHINSNHSEWRRKQIAEILNRSGSKLFFWNRLMRSRF